MSTAVACHDLRKRYGRTGPWVLCGIDATVEHGGIVRVSGPNGAGKSTLLRIVAGACLPSGGTRRVAPGVAVGYAPERAAPPGGFMSARYLDHHARIRGLDAATRRRQVDELAERLGCGPALRQRLGALSKGTLRKVVVAQALLGGPGLLVLDEPFAGLDVDARAAVADLLAERARDGAAVVLSDHRQGGEQLTGGRHWVLDAGRLRELGAVGGEPVRTVVAADASDRELVRLVADGWHVVRVRPVEPGRVEIEAVPPQVEP
jgi:ABC-2 type transport system ATP-binding protein